MVQWVHANRLRHFVYRLIPLLLTLAVLGAPTAWAAKITVDSRADNLNEDDSCTLREAIIAANTNTTVDGCAAGDADKVDVIVLRAGTYRLAIPGVGENGAASGDLDVTDDLILKGRKYDHFCRRWSRWWCAAGTTIDASGLDRVFHVMGASVTFFKVTITNGATDLSGGGIRNDGGTVRLKHSTVTGNITQKDGGGIRNNGGTVHLIRSTVSENVAMDAGAGIFNDGGTVRLKHSTVSDNTAFHDGGGIRNSLGTLELISSTVSGNTTQDDGGGIRNNGGTVILTKSTVSGNSADDGLVDDFINSHGGGIYNACTTGCPDGTPTTVTLMNSTISENFAEDHGGGLRNEFGGTVTLIHSTITANMAKARAGGVRNLGTVSFKNTIIAGNESEGEADCRNTAEFTSLGHNLVGHGTGCPSSAIGDQTVDPVVVFTEVLGHLRDNGGPTETHALVPFSPAIDAASTDCPSPTTDQRGVRRPQGLACDIGAYEARAHPARRWRR